MNETEVRMRRLEGILAITRELTSAVPLDALLARVVAIAAELTGSEESSILLCDNSTGELRFRTAFGATSGKILEADIPVPVDTSIAGAVLTSGQPLIIADAQDDPRLYREVERRTGFEVRSLLAVPLQVGGRRIGVLEALNKQGDGEFTQGDVETLTALATHAAVAIENARLYWQLRDHAERLEERVQERTAEIQARNEELRAYAHTVAHDLKTPLVGVMGFAELLGMRCATCADGQATRCVEGIMQAGRKMRSIVEALLLLAEVRDGEVQLELLDMAFVVGEVRQRLAPLIGEYGAEVLLPDSWPAALGYGPWVEEVWANYVSNAVKYGGQPPRVELGATEQPDGTVRFWVADNGRGLTPEARGLLFTPFTRLDQVRAEGHGLGLSIVQRIMQKLGGEVGVEGEVGRGSIFYFTLPAAESGGAGDLESDAQGGNER